MHDEHGGVVRDGPPPASLYERGSLLFAEWLVELKPGLVAAKIHFTYSPNTAAGTAQTLCTVAIGPAIRCAHRSERHDRPPGFGRDGTSLLQKGADPVQTRRGVEDPAGMAGAQENSMRRAMAVMILLALTGCAGLVIKHDDPESVKTQKVLTRSVLAVITLGISESVIAGERRRAEARDQRELAAAEARKRQELHERTKREFYAGWKRKILQSRSMEDVSLAFASAPAGCEPSSPGRKICTWTAHGWLLGEQVPVRCMCIVNAETGSVDPTKCRLTFE